MFIHETSTSIQLTGSPSLLLNNLSSDVNNLLFVRLNEVYTVRTAGEAVKLPTAKSKIYQASFVNIGGTSAIVILSSLGLQIWSGHGDTMLFHYPMSSVFEVDIGEEKYMRGIAATQNYLCIGTSISNVLVFNCGDLSEGGDFPLAHSLSTDDYGVPISAMAASSSSGGGVLAVGNDNGKLFGYRSDEAFAGAFTFEGYGHPVTALAVNDHVLIAAYSSGHIRLFRTDIVELAIELTAHTRIVSGLLVGPGADYFISCSQDQYVHVWSLPDFRSRGGSEIGLIYSELLENKICTGVAGLSDNRFAVACYDDDEITIFNRN